jgi:DNA-binding NtrC family response regulator
MRVLVLGALPAPIRDLTRLLTEGGHEPVFADRQGLDAMAQASSMPQYDLILLDLAMPDFDTLRQHHAIMGDTPVILLGRTSDRQAAKAGIAGGAFEFIDYADLASTLIPTLRLLDERRHRIVSGDPKTQELVSLATRIAASDASVLVLGETGTGKELFARHIHRKSRRATGPFVALNCAAIPENLLESELFGYEKGAFSGALARRIGKFEAANGGTLLLDEIGEIDLRLQAKLLRAIQEREIDRVGGQSPVRVNVRIVATTNRDLRAEAARGRFREDLFFRLNVVSLTIPPLRARPGDIPLLVDYFARKYADLNQLPQRRMSPASLQTVLARPWPGNIRELENAIHRSVLVSQGDMLEIEPDPALASAEQAANAPAAPPLNTYVGKRLEDIERDLIIQTIGYTRGNRTHAANLLGISIRSLRNKLREYAAAPSDVPVLTQAAAPEDAYRRAAHA